MDPKSVWLDTLSLLSDQLDQSLYASLATSKFDLDAELGIVKLQVWPKSQSSLLNASRGVIANALRTVTEAGEIVVEIVADPISVEAPPQGDERCKICGSTEHTTENHPKE